MSLHRYDNMTFFPRRADSGSAYIGQGAGAGFNVNVAWETGKVADEEVRGNNEMTDLGCCEYKYACEHLLFKIAREFSPDLILISCGFDGAIHDELGWSRLSPLMYYWMTAELCKICPKVVVMQEGGYNTDYLGQHASGVAKALLGQENYGEPVQADIDVGYSETDQIKSEDA